jgi:hypothetical protein
MVSPTTQRAHCGHGTRRGQRSQERRKCAGKLRPRPCLICTHPLHFQRRNSLSGILYQQLASVVSAGTQAAPVRCASTMAVSNADPHTARARRWPVMCISSLCQALASHYAHRLLPFRPIIACSPTPGLRLRWRPCTVSGMPRRSQQAAAMPQGTARLRWSHPNAFALFSRPTGRYAYPCSLLLHVRPRQHWFHLVRARGGGACAGGPRCIGRHVRDCVSSGRVGRSGGVRPYAQGARGAAKRFEAGWMLGWSVRRPRRHDETLPLRLRSAAAV